MEFLSKEGLEHYHSLIKDKLGGDSVYDTNGVNITDTTGTRVKIGNGATTYNYGVAIGVSAKAGNNVMHRGSVAIGNGAQVSASNAIAIGPASIASKVQTVSIGNGAGSYTDGATAIGQNAYAYGENSVALGTNSYSEDANVVSVGDPGYEPDEIPPYYRKITCVEDGTDAHDAATVGQMPKERELTQAEYDALTEDEKNNGATYYIKDGISTESDAFFVPSKVVLNSYGSYSSTTTLTIPRNGFLTGKALGLAGNVGAYITSEDGSIMYGGIPYSQYAGNIQVGFCLPVSAGQVYKFQISGNAKFEVVKLVEAIPIYTPRKPHEPYFYAEQNSQIQGTWSSATLITGLKFTVTESGVYSISASGNIGEANGSTAFPRIGIYINGNRGQYSAIRLVASDQKTWSTQQVSALNVGDVVEVRIWGASTKVSLFEGQRLTAFRIA